METNWTIDDDMQLIQQLYQTARMYSKTLNSTISSYGIFSSEWTLLHIVFTKGECSQSDMIRHLGVEPAAVSKTLSKMERKGIIHRESHHSRRGKFVTLTEKGRELCENLTAKVVEHRQKALADIPTSQRQELFHLLQTVEKNLDETEKR